MYASRPLLACEPPGLATLIGSVISLRYNSPQNKLPATRQLGPFPILGLWAALCFAGGLYASWLGYGGRAFAATLTAFSFYFAVMLLLAARGVPEFLSSRLGAGSAYLLGAAALLAYLLYALGTSTFALSRAGAIAAVVFIPLALAASAVRQLPGAWQDYVTLAGIWVAVKFSPSHWLWPYPNQLLPSVFTFLPCLTSPLSPFVLIRKIPGIGYTIGWGSRWGFFPPRLFTGFGAIALPLRTTLHFIQFAPHWHAWRSLPFVSVAIFFFTAWLHQFLFRRLLQNF